MPRDVYLFLFGLVLVIPLSILANMLTPTIKDWLASRSRARLQARISQLKREIEIAPPPFEWSFPMRL